uniref:Uncharacterized protein n=1 Tax=Oryza punctata TaxID=4537 RepID=A0A0E0M8B1_ORYPU
MGEAPPRWPTSVVVTLLTSPIHRARLAFGLFHAILVNSGIGVAATSSSSFFHASDMSQADREHTGQAKLGISDGQDIPDGSCARSATR